MQLEQVNEQTNEVLANEQNTAEQVMDQETTTEKVTENAEMPAEQLPEATAKQETAPEATLPETETTVAETAPPTMDNTTDVDVAEPVAETIAEETPKAAQTTEESEVAVESEPDETVMVTAAIETPQAETVVAPVVNEKKQSGQQLSQEVLEKLSSWWQQQNFAGKEFFTLTGNIIKVLPTQFLRERNIATITPENCDFVLRNLREKFSDVESKLNEIEVEWLAADDKLKVADKVDHYKEYIQHINAIGDYSKPLAVVADWQKAIGELIAGNLDIKTKLAEIAESYAESTLWREGTQAFKDLNDKWKQAGYIDKSRNDELWNRIEAARKTFHDRKRMHHDDEEKDMLRALDLKIELAEQAEALANSEQWKATSEKFQEIMEKWKAIGRTLPKKNEELWQRIIAAKSAFYERKKVHFNQIQEEQQVNLEKKLALVDRAEAMKESTDWAATAQAYSQLMDEWKKSGRVQQEKADELWKRFIDAHEHFFEAKRKHTDGIRLELENNYNLKNMLLKKAEELKNSSRWGEVTVEMNQLFEEWKKIGPLPREHSKKMWEAFIAARKHFFARKDAHRAQRKTFAEAKKSARMQQAHELVYKSEQEIALEHERLADLKAALDNVTPGKKAEELKKHLNVLISDSNAKLKRLNEKLEAGREELQDLMEREKREQERAEQGDDADTTKK